MLVYEEKDELFWLELSRVARPEVPVPHVRRATPAPSSGSSPADKPDGRVEDDPAARGRSRVRRRPPRRHVLHPHQQERDELQGRDLPGREDRPGELDRPRALRPEGVHRGRRRCSRTTRCCRPASAGRRNSSSATSRPDESHTVEFDGSRVRRGAVAQPGVRHRHDPLHVHVARRRRTRSTSTT